MCGFNYRFVPAVRLARQLLEAGELGELFHFRARYLQSWGIDAEPSLALREGGGRLGRARRPRRARHRPGPLPRRRAGRGDVRRSNLRRGPRGGRRVRGDGRVRERRVGTIEASRLARGRINQNTFELNGSRGSVSFDVERLNELQVADEKWFRRVLVTEPEHPFMSFWWPPGHIVGWGDTFTHELHHLLTAIAGGRTSLRTGRRSRTATGAPRSATRSCARRRAAGADDLLRARVKTSLGIWAFGAMATRFVPTGTSPSSPSERPPSACEARSSRSEI